MRRTAEPDFDRDDGGQVKGHNQMLHGCRHDEEMVEQSSRHERKPFWRERSQTDPFHSARTGMSEITMPA